MLSKLFNGYDRDFVQNRVRKIAEYLLPSTQRYCSKLYEKENNRSRERSQLGDKVKCYKYRLNDRIFNCLYLSPCFVFIIYIYRHTHIHTCAYMYVYVLYVCIVCICMYV